MRSLSRGQGTRSQSRRSLRLKHARLNRSAAEVIVLAAAPSMSFPFLPQGGVGTREGRCHGAQYAAAVGGVEERDHPNSLFQARKWLELFKSALKAGVQIRRKGRGGGVG